MIVVQQDTFNILYERIARITESLKIETHMA